MLRLSILIDTGGNKRFIRISFKCSDLSYKLSRFKVPLFYSIVPTLFAITRFAFRFGSKSLFTATTITNFGARIRT